MNDWKPIETAPKDGTPVDLWVLGDRTADCTWNKTRKRWEHWWGLDGGMGRSAVDGEPTHWMPLPEPPMKEGT